MIITLRRESAFGRINIEIDRIEGSLAITAGSKCGQSWAKIKCVFVSYRFGNPTWTAVSGNYFLTARKPHTKK